MDKILIEIDAENKDLADAITNLVSDVDRQSRVMASSKRAFDYGKIERRTAELLNDVERACHRQMLEALDVDEKRVVIGDDQYQRVERSRGTYHCRGGDVPVMRSLYRKVGQRNARVVDPVSLRAGVVGDGWLPHTAEAMAYLLQQGTSREAEKTALETATLPFSRSSFERVGHLVGQHYVGVREVIEEVLIDTFEPPAEAFSVSASLDRVSIPMEEPAPERSEQKVERNFRMAFCGTVTLHDEDGKALYTIRYGRMPNGSAVELCDALANDVLELVAKKPSLAVMLLADGAHEMWNLLEAEFTVDRIKAKVNELVDFWHLVEKLTPAAKILCNFNEKEASSKMGRWRFELLNSSDGADKILAELKASGRDQGPNKECPVHAAITYLSNHKDRMDYASARAAGLPIGSGQVEASCKSLVSTRMKRPGSRWKETTGDHIIQLRSLSLSDRWQNAIRLGLSPLRVAVRLVA